LARFKLRDRDAIVTREGIIFRVYGYSHSPEGFVCDPEYAPAKIFQSENPRAYRVKGKRIYYKFYADEGLRFVQEKYPQYMVWSPLLQTRLVGVNQDQIIKAKHPDKTLKTLSQKKHTDPLLRALHELLNLVEPRSSLSKSDFGVFGSLLHDFYHPSFSDLDFLIYGREELKHLRETLSTIYNEKDTPLRNEFDTMESVREKRWKFKNCSLKDYVWHQKRKQVYALFDYKSGRAIKVEFEPVKRWEEIQNEYTSKTSITRKGWTRLIARVIDDKDAAFMPSVYQIEPLNVIKGEPVDDILRIVSYVEEFRMQAFRDELVVAEGNLEQVNTPTQSFHQITLTYGRRYYEQTLKRTKQ